MFSFLDSLYSNPVRKETGTVLGDNNYYGTGKQRITGVYNLTNPLVTLSIFRLQTLIFKAQEVKSGQERTPRQLETSTEKRGLDSDARINEQWFSLPGTRYLPAPRLILCCRRKLTPNHVENILDSLVVDFIHTTGRRGNLPGTKTVGLVQPAVKSQVFATG